MQRSFIGNFLLGALAAAGLALLIYQIPVVHSSFSWRLELAATYLRGIIYPADRMPMPVSMAETANLNAATPPSPGPTGVRSAPPPPVGEGKRPLPGISSEEVQPIFPSPQATLSHGRGWAVGPGEGELSATASPTPRPTATPIPASVSLPAPEYQKQDINNCGPASLALALRYFGWEGDQYAISDQVKPFREDRNVNVEELIFYARNHAGWLNAEYRVGGQLDWIRQLVAAGLPVLIEESFRLDAPFWPRDDRWAGHYLLVTGYDDNRQVFTTQDTYYGPDMPVTYETLDENWKGFNRVIILLYPPDQAQTVQDILGPDWDPDTNRQHALETAQAETRANPDDAFAWFNLGSNQVYFERYAEAAQAYDTARTLTLPQRMLRYQFGPFLAYFHSGRNADLLAISEYALERTPNAEEAHLWQGWALYREGDPVKAGGHFQQALEANPGYQDARYALDFLSQDGSQQE
jgi:tetratricopeptide (TPR) repeat protein